MSIEKYSLSIDFPNGLYSEDLRKEIESTLNEIYPLEDINCLMINTDDDEVDIYFSTILTTSEKSTLDTIIQNYVPIPPENIIIADRFCVNEPLKKMEVYALNSLVIDTNVSYPINFIKLVGGMNYFNPTTGIFNPTQEGIYLYNISFDAVGSNGNNLVKLRILDNNQIIMGHDVSLNQTESVYGFIGNGSYITSSSNIKFSLSTDVLPLTCNIKVKFLQLFI